MKVDKHFMLVHHPRLHVNFFYLYVKSFYNLVVWVKKEVPF